MKVDGKHTRTIWLEADGTTVATIDQRKLMAFGLSGIALAMYELSTWTPDVPARHVMLVLLGQGFCMGCFFNPMTVMAYTTLPPHLRPEATAVQALARHVHARTARTSHAD